MEAQHADEFTRPSASDGEDRIWVGGGAKKWSAVAFARDGVLCESRSGAVDFVSADAEGSFSWGRG